MKIISIVNNKGGVGKTTSTINISSILAEKFKKKVLLVDLDPQASATIYLGLNPLELNSTIYDVLVKQTDIRKSILSISKTLHLLPSSIELSAGEIEISSKFGREFLLKDILKNVEDYYDYIIIDNMPSLGVFTVNSLMASNYYIAPVEASYLSMKGLEILFQTVNELKKLNQDIQFLGVLVTLFDMRTKHQNEVLENIKNKYKVFTQIVKRSTKFQDSCLACKSIYEYDKNFEGSKSYIGVVEEIMMEVSKNG
jgi:chromosome partitioning protein